MDFIDKIYIINLPEATERWNKCLEQFKNNDITNYERIDGYKFTSIKDIPRQYLTNLKKKRFNNNSIIGSYGCKKAHLEILNNHLDDPNKNILILEDDFVIKPNFKTELDKTIKTFKSINNYKNYKLLYLGATYYSSIVKEQIIDNIYSIKNPYGTYAYIINTNYINEIYNYCCNNDFQIDVNYKELSNGGDFYCIIPSLITHADECYSYIRKKIRKHNNLL